ncbi:MAG: hypothetical protein HQM12_23605 [SAR324 cluster bacterium]|nr:hypothetical protein [SAR324 cluster bacterium]
MNIKQTPVTNAANLSMFMVNLSHIVSQKTQETDQLSILDLKAHFQALFYLDQILKIDPQIQTVISFEKLQNSMADIGRVHKSRNVSNLRDNSTIKQPLSRQEHQQKIIKEPRGYLTASKSWRIVLDCLKFIIKIAS